MRLPGILVVAVCAYQAHAGSAPVRREYRAHAYVRVLGIPIFSRQDVGGGYAVVEESESEKTLIFAGGSALDRAHGLNRVGLIQEVVSARPHHSEEFEYFGFMVSSAEASVEQASNSLRAKTGETVTYSAASGHGSDGNFVCTLSHLQMPSTYTWAHVDQLRREISNRYDDAPDVRQTVVNLNSSRTFLDSIHRAILSPARRSSHAVVYNGKKYLLTTEKQEDNKMRRELVARKVVSDKARLVRLNGVLIESTTQDKTQFEVWLDEGDATGLPVRIEFYPKSFLKLVFEQRGT